MWYWEHSMYKLLEADFLGLEAGNTGRVCIKIDGYYRT